MLDRARAVGTRSGALPAISALFGACPVHPLALRQIADACLTEDFAVLPVNIDTLPMDRGLLFAVQPMKSAAVHPAAAALKVAPLHRADDDAHLGQYIPLHY